MLYEYHDQCLTFMQDLFIQEDPSTKLDTPGQQPNFGALLPWAQILDKLDANRKLLLLVRHGEAMHNVIQAYVGEDEWKRVTEQCTWTNGSSGETFQLFDPPLTENGVAQVRSSYWFADANLSSAPCLT